METNTTPSKSYLQFGLFYGILVILAFVLIYVADVNILENRIIGTSSSILNYFVFPLLFIFLGCNSFKKGNNGFISFVESLKVGVSIAFVAGLIFALFNLVFNLIFPQYNEEILKYTRQLMLEQNPNLTSEQVEKGISLSRKVSSPLFSVPITLVTFSLLGFIYSLIIGLIVKKDNPAGF